MQGKFQADGTLLLRVARTEPIYATLSNVVIRASLSEGVAPTKFDHPFLDDEIKELEAHHQLFHSTLQEGGEELMETTRKAMPAINVKVRGGNDIIDHLKPLFPHLKTHQQRLRAAVNTVGAPHGSTVRFRPTGYGVGAEIDHPDISSMDVKLNHDNGANRRIYLNELFMKAGHEGGGLGSHIIGQQAAHGYKHGFESIGLDGIGDGESYHQWVDSGKPPFGHGKYNGYYVWPLLGFDAFLPSYKKAAKDAFPNAETIQDIMSTDEGRNWWSKHGTGDHFEFDLRPGSLSHNILDNHLARKAKRDALEPPPDWPGDNEGLDEAYVQEWDADQIEKEFLVESDEEGDEEEKPPRAVPRGKFIRAKRIEPRILLAKTGGEAPGHVPIKGIHPGTRNLLVSTNPKSDILASGVYGDNHEKAGQEYHVYSDEFKSQYPRPSAHHDKAIALNMVPAHRDEAKVVLSNGKDAPSHIKPSMIPAGTRNFRVALDPSSEVWITPGENKGRSSGRTKAVHNPSYTQRAEEVRQARVLRMMDDHDKIQQHIQGDRKKDHTRDLAEIAWLLDKHGIRIGGDDTTREEKLRRAIDFDTPLTHDMIVVGKGSVVKRGANKGQRKPGKIGILIDDDPENPIRGAKRKKMRQLYGRSNVPPGKQVVAVDDRVKPGETDYRDEGTAERLERHKKKKLPLGTVGDWLKAHGATTLQGRHVTMDEEGMVHLQFVGKKGVWHDHLVSDKELSNMLLERKKKAGDNGRLFNVPYAKARQYVQSLGAGGYTPHDFRRKRGTLIAKRIIDKHWGDKPFKTDAEFEHALDKVAKIVAAKLGNHPTEARDTYIMPKVYERFRPKSGVEEANTPLGHPFGTAGRIPRTPKNRTNIAADATPGPTSPQDPPTSGIGSPKSVSVELKPRPPGLGMGDEWLGAPASDPHSGSGYKHPQSPMGGHLHVPELIKKKHGTSTPKEAMATSELASTRHISGTGGVNTSYKMAFSNGDEALFKPASGEAYGIREGIPKGHGYKREAAVSDIADVLGMSDLVPPTVVYDHPTLGKGSLQKWIKGKEASKHFHDEMFDGPKDHARAAAFDYVIGNTDRHANNWMLTDEGKLQLIDHGYSMSNHADDYTTANLVNQAGSYGLEVPKEAGEWNWDDVEEILDHHKISKRAKELVRQRFEHIQDKVGEKFRDLNDFGDFTSNRQASSGVSVGSGDADYSIGMS